MTGLAPEQQRIRDAIAKLCADFPDGYWLERDREAKFPEEFYATVARGGWLGIAMPEAYGGAGLGIAEAAMMMQAVAQSGAGFSGASALHMNIFGLNPVVCFGSDGAEAALPAAADPRQGEGVLRRDRARCRPRHDASQDEGGARRRPLCRLRPQDLDLDGAGRATRCCCWRAPRRIEQAKKPSDGISLFYTDLDRSAVEVREIAKMGRHAVDSNMLFIDGLEVPCDDLIGEEGEGFQQILHGMNPERILIAAEAVGLGFAALAKAAAYAKERVVFGRPIGQNQGDPASAGAKLDGARGGGADGASRGLRSTTRASPAGPRPTPPSISPPRPAGAPARRRS